jgi:hypothetical protein
MAMKTEVMVFWVMWDTNVLEDYAASIFKGKVARASKTVVSYHITTRCQNPEDHGSGFSLFHSVFPFKFANIF